MKIIKKGILREPISRVSCYHFHHHHNHQIEGSRIIIKIINTVMKEILRGQTSRVPAILELTQTCQRGSVNDDDDNDIDDDKNEDEVVDEEGQNQC